MKTFSTLVCLVFITGHLCAQDYLITFTGSGGSSNVETVLVQNLTQGTALSIAGSDTLRLTGSLGVFAGKSLTLPVSVYPNPLKGSASASFQTVNSGPVSVRIVSASGKTVCSYHGSLDRGFHTFRINGLVNGMYRLEVITEQYAGTAGIVSLDAGGYSPDILYLRSEPEGSLQPSLKSAAGIVPMQYNAGDQLLFTGSADIFATVFPFVAVANTEIAFFFVEATDGDGNHYPTVTIGSQIWLAKNLKTTKYTDGGAIEYPGADNNAWMTNTTGAYAWYDNSIGNKDVYGALYNWYAADTSILCPNGWHVPTDEEWTTLTTFLGGMDIAGGKLKETGLLHWIDPNLDATNVTGFTALPGGNRNGNGSFAFLGSAGNWWSATADILGAYDRHLYNSNGSIYRELYGMNMGFSVRCVRDR